MLSILQPPFGRRAVSLQCQEVQIEEMTGARRDTQMIYPRRDRALALVNAFLRRTPNASTHFVHFQRDEVADGLLDRINAPHLEHFSG